MTTDGATRQRKHRAKMRAIGYYFSHGERVPGPPPPKMVPPHGTSARYQRRCRCGDCREANARRSRLRYHGLGS